MQVATELRYADGALVEIRVQTRGHFTHLDDAGDAVAKARALGASGAWLPIAEDVVAREGFNVNRRGVVFVSVGRGRDVEGLAARLAECSYAVHAALLDTAP